MQSGSAEAELRIFSSQDKTVQSSWKCGTRTGPYPTDCHCQCWRTTLLTATIVIPNEGQCGDHVWLKYKDIRNAPDKVIMLPQRLGGNNDLRPILGRLLQG